jgi:hypothetical protein
MMIKKYHRKVCKKYLKMGTDRERGFTGHSRARRVKQYLKAVWMPIYFWRKIDKEAHGE